MHASRRSVVAAVGTAALAALAVVAMPDRERLARIEPIPPGAPLVASHPVTDDDVRRAIARALPPLEHEGRDWLDGRVPVQGGDGCVSCHHVGFALWSHAEAARAGIAIPRAAIAALEADAIDFLAQPDKPRTVSTSQLMLAGAPDANPLDALLDALLDAQRADGSWRARGQFPDQRRDIAETDATMSLWMLLALRDSPRERLAELATRANDWRRGDLEARIDDPTTTVEWLAAGLLAAEGDAERDRLRRRLLDARGGDGGWPWRAGEASNAFSTGQALYALARDGIEREAIDAGRAFLVATQQPDGRWSIPPGSVSTHDGAAQDVIYGYWSTAWAAIGLARSLPGVAAQAARSTDD